MNDLAERITESEELIRKLEEDYEFLPDTEARARTRILREYEEENRDNLKIIYKQIGE
jgi:hypothetical protein